MNSDHNDQGEMEVFFGGISVHSKVDDLKAFIEQNFGKIKEISMPINEKTGLALGFSRIMFWNKSDAIGALAKKNILINGIRVAIKRWVQKDRFIQCKQEDSLRKL